MKVQKVRGYNLESQFDVQNQTNVATRSISLPAQSPDSVSFTGAPSVKNVSETMERIMPTALTGMKKAKDSMGEVQNIMINALGTGLVAPVFIKWNPLSKTDEDTRTYSAWRQPVSALLTIATQVAITIPFNKAIVSMAKDGSFGEKFNETPYTGEGAEQKLLENLRNKNTILYNTSKFDGNQKLKEIDPERYKRLLNETLEGLLKKENEEFARCNGAKKDLRIARSKFYQAHPDESKKVLDEIGEIVNAKKDVKEIQKDLAAKIKQMKANKADPELIKIVQEIEERGAVLQENWFSKFLGLFSKNKGDNKELGEYVVGAMQEKVNKMKGHVDIYRNLTAAEAEKHAAESMATRLDQIRNSQNFLKNAIEKLKNGATVTDIEKLFSEEVAKDSSFRLKDKVFAEEVVKKLKELTKNNISTFKQMSGLIVSCAMLPVTCALLNYLYPIFMDAVFPNLSNKKHSNVSSELVDKATKNSEVK